MSVAKLLPALLAFLFLAAGGAAHAETLTAADLKLYRAAFAAADKERWTEARELSARAKHSLLAKVIQWMDLVRPGPGRRFDEYTLFLKYNPDWPYRNTLWAQAERAMPDSLAPDLVLQWFQSREPLTLPGATRLARALLARGQEKQAVELARRGWIELDGTAEEEALFLTLFGRHLRPSEHEKRLDRLLWQGQQTAARRMMPRVDVGHQRLAEARLRLMNMDPGVDAAVKRVPRSLMRDAGLLYERARWRRRKGMLDGVIELLDPPPDIVARPDIFWPEKESAARYALARGHVSAAYRLAQSHGLSQGVGFADGEWLAGWVALRFLEDRKTAYEHFTRLYAGVGTGISLARAAYWAGRAAEEMGEVALAQDWYAKAAQHATTYYGQLAAHRIGRTDALAFQPLPEPSKAEIASFAQIELVRVARLLGQIGEVERTRPFLLRLADIADTPAAQRLVADLALELGREDLAVAVAKSMRLKGADLIEYLYPMRKLPAGGGPEEALVLAVMRQESAFSTTAVSPAGARGLMQLMPATAKQVAKRLRLDYSKERLTADPNFNILLGRAYLEELVASFRGSYVLAIAAYNAGPGRVVEWIRQYGDPRDYGVDVVDWVESIPFAETRNYVQRVMENLQVYRHRLGDTQVALSLEQDLGLRSAP